MLEEPVIVIFKERNDVNVCAIPFSAYPTGKVPEVGDRIPLYAERTFNVSVGDGPVKPLAIKYLDELATVVEVWAGNGNLLHPKNGCGYYSFPEDWEGYGIQVAWQGEPIPKGMTSIQAEVVFGL